MLTADFITVLGLLLSVISISEQKTVESAPAKEWDFLTLAQFWPSTSCVYFSESRCVPNQVTGWTIHGLWPSSMTGEDPFFCNDSLTFDYNQIKSLRPRLDQNWPFYKEGNVTGLWSHEWSKHGTCAYQVEALRGEYNYFSTTLDLHDHINTSKILSDAGIIASKTKKYDPEEIFNVVKNSSGYVPNIVCYYDETKQTHYLEQVNNCFNKDFTKRDCPEVESSSVSHPGDVATSGGGYLQDCPKKGGVFYLPLAKKSVERSKEDTALRFRKEKEIAPTKTYV